MLMVEGLRRDALASKRDELTRLETVHRRSVHELRLVYTAIDSNASLQSLIPPKYDLSNVSDDETAFLKNNDLACGGFDTTSLALRPSAPAPPPQNKATISVQKPNSGVAESSQHVQDSTSAVATPVQAIVTVQADESTTSELLAAPILTPALPTVDHKPAPSVPASRNASAQPEDAPPAQIAPQQPEETAELSDATEQMLDQQQPSRPAKVVHLPPPEVQEERLHELEADERRRRSDSELKSSQRLAAPQTELASSPSSTVGAYSAATPQPPQDSPDTSPDSDTAQSEVLPPKELQPAAEEVREKEEHDRLLEAQKEIARKQALGDVTTPDDQLKWEAREAAAREASEQAARDEAGGPEPDAKSPRESTEAGQVVEEMQADEVAEQPVSNELSEESKSVGEQPVAKPTPPSESRDECDTIAVARRTKLAPLTVDTSTTSGAAPPMQTQSVPVPARTERMTTRVASGAMRQKSVSEILGQDRDRSMSADNTPSMRKEVQSPEAISPLTQRHPLDNSSAPPKTTPLPQFVQQTRAATHHHHTSDADHVLDQLESLRGAADDSERDYLEPLFRIQAHESPSSRTKPLPDLIKMGPKALSTEDHYTSIHERLDFRMLRRIYQLQNANKWSLRQMEKAKEPEKPVTHHDHMMAEMKEMRKDFKAERKMKKNVCAWLAQRCVEYWHASPAERVQLRVNAVIPPARRPSKKSKEIPPELEHAGESASEDDTTPPTPRAGSPLPTTIVVPPELQDAVETLKNTGKLEKHLAALPKAGLLDLSRKHEARPYTAVSKFVEGKVLPKSNAPSRKRSRYEYEDEGELLDSQPSTKRHREDRQLPPEGVDCALFHPDNKPIRDRLHSNNAFRPPSEFPMPTIHFYEFRTGSQWIWEDDQKLRKLAKEYSFNWSLISDEMTLPTRYKSSAERRTPWECFERWVELESLPADMRKTMYFRTWLSRLEHSQQAAERRYQAQVQAIHAQAAQTGQQGHLPMRRRSVPMRVEKRRSQRYLWMVDGFRKLAKKKEQAQWKAAETARAAAQRKSQTEPNQVRQMKMTPQEFSKKRYERDMQIIEAQKQHRAKIIEAQQRQLQLARAQQQGQAGAQNLAPGQQRPPGANMPAQQAQMQANGQPLPNIQGNAQMAAQPPNRQQIPIATRNGHLAVPQVNGQGIPQAQMQPRPAQMTQQHPNMQQMQQPNAQMQNAQFGGQQYQMPNGNMSSPGGMTNQQQMQNNQALLQAFRQQQQASNSNQTQNMHQNNSGQMSSSPSMPPPPTPQGVPQQLSSGHVPQIIAIKNQLRASNPSFSEDQLSQAASAQLQKQSQTTNAAARQSAMNAAAGINSQSMSADLTSQSLAYNQAAFQNNRQMVNGMNGLNGMYGNVNMNGDGSGQQQTQNMSPVGQNANSAQNQQAYAQKMMRMQQMQMGQAPGQLNGSPGVAHASPNLAPVSPSMQFANMQMNQMGNMQGMNGQRPPSRSNTPQMRVGSSGSGVAMGNGMQSPGSSMGQPVQGSPRNMQANMAR